jgi:DNA repair exonuclease SbcCD ATPase subunit
METRNQTIQRLQEELSACERIGVRNLEILQNLRGTNTRLNEALAAQAVHIEDLEKELDHQLSELRSLCERVQEPMSGTGGT